MQVFNMLVRILTASPGVIYTIILIAVSGCDQYLVKHPPCGADLQHSNYLSVNILLYGSVMKNLVPKTNN